MSVGGIEKHLRRNVVRRATYGLLALTGAFDECSESKVANFDIHVRIQEEVAKFEITMDDLVRVHVVTSSNELNHEESSLRFSEAATAAKHIHERTARAQLQRHVNIGFIFETLLEADDIGVLEGLVDLDFGVQLNACSAAGSNGMWL